MKPWMVIGIVFGLTIIIILSDAFFIPAYQSTKLDCFVPASIINSCTNSNETTLQSSAVFEVINDTPSITYYQKPSLQDIRHEECHLKQYEEHRIFNCNNVIGIYFNELEASVSEKTFYNC